MKNITLIIAILISMSVVGQNLRDTKFKSIYKKPHAKIYVELLNKGFTNYKDTSNVFYKYLRNNTSDSIELFIRNDEYVYILQSESVVDYVHTTHVLDNLLLSIDEETSYNIFSHNLKKYLGYHIFNDEKQVCLINKY
ncbi:MAG: hypothetical protein ACYTCN_07085 [Planctomycetota bacterium]|jgi:hypothetical protein